MGDKKKKDENAVIKFLLAFPRLGVEQKKCITLMQNTIQKKKHKRFVDSRKDHLVLLYSL